MNSNGTGSSVRHHFTIFYWMPTAGVKHLIYWQEFIQTFKILENYFEQKTLSKLCRIFLIFFHFALNHSTLIHFFYPNENELQINNAFLISMFDFFALNFSDWHWKNKFYYEFMKYFIWLYLHPRIDKNQFRFFRSNKLASTFKIIE